jgi:hypothetical protein
MKFKRFNFGCTTHDNSIIVAGGIGGLSVGMDRNCYLKTVEYFDTKNETWTLLTNCINYTRENLIILKLKNNFLILGGKKRNEEQIFDEYSNTLTLDNTLNWKSEKIINKRQRIDKENLNELNLRYSNCSFLVLKISEEKILF